MLITRTGFRGVYDTIRDDATASAGGCTVLLLVALDCDAICAARILTVSRWRCLILVPHTIAAPRLSCPCRRCSSRTTWSTAWPRLRVRRI